MNELRTGTGLSTADMVEGMEQRDGAPAAVAESRRSGDGMSGTEAMQPGDGATSEDGQRDGAVARAANGGPTTEMSGAAEAPLLADEQASDFRERWTTIQAGFVDEPRRAVEQADALVAEAITHLAEVFAEERATLEAQWSRGDEVSTDDLRLALQRYRSFFQRLLAV